MSISLLGGARSGATLTPSEFRQFKVICAALWCFYHVGAVHYSNVRGRGLTDQFKPPPYVPEEMDCSGFVEYCFTISGCPSPSGSDGPSTATFWNNGIFLGGADTKVSVLQPGDVVFYSYDTQGPMRGGNSEHCALYIRDGKVASLGSDAGVLVLDWNGSDKPVRGVRRYPF